LEIFSLDKVYEESEEDSKVQGTGDKVKRPGDEPVNPSPMRMPSLHGVPLVLAAVVDAMSIC